METGKTSKYLKYAIGEIILVVIGILIALQINNWNELRKEHVIEKRYIEDLLLDLKNDSLNISNTYSEVSEVLRTRALFRDILKGENSNTDSLIYYFDTQWFQSQRFTATTATIDEIKSNGHFGMIRNLAVKRSIVEIYNLFENHKILENDFVNAQREMITLLGEVMPDMLDYKEEDILKIKDYPKVFNALTLNYASTRTEAYKDILDQCMYTIQELQVYYKTL